MCGIFCVVRYGHNNPVKMDIERLCQCLNLLKPRGPDSTSYKIINVNPSIDIFMGFTRLAIMDTSSSGMQPFEDLEGNNVICNGEIYNYKELTKKYQLPYTECDCKILLPLINKLGITNTITTELDAEYAMVMFSKQKSILYAVRDRYGVRPLYYGYNNKTKCLGFSSELKALHDIMEVVYQLKPNNLCAINLNKTDDDLQSVMTMIPYYNYNNLIANIALTDINYIKDQINDILTQAVRKRLQSDRPIGFLLSGGLDSSLIVAIASKIIGPDKMVCFTIGVENSPDVLAAKKVVEFLKINNHHIINFDINDGIKNLENVIKTIETYDVTTVRASTPQYMMAKYISENTNIKVLLSGEGSDEIHGSYRYFRDAPDIVKFHQESIRLLEELYYFDNKRVDRTMSGNGLEVRVPFLDYEYVEFITRINPELLMYKSTQMEKQLLRDSFIGYLPNDILYRSKEAFSDAVSSDKLNWASSIKTYLDEINFTSNTVYQYNPPLTTDGEYFRYLFARLYPNRETIIPHYWLPKFQKKIVLDPSATVLDCY